jgi:hypothetical protein
VTRALLLAAVCLAAGASAAIGGVIPDPSAHKTLTIHTMDGQVIELLVPSGNHYDIYDRRRSLSRLGYTKRVGSELVLYDLNDHITGYARLELLPPDADLSDVAVVRDRLGNRIGLLSRY